MSDNVILGAGIAGISAGYHWKKAGIPCVIYEKDGDWGGLCGNFSLDGFRFDRFVHLSFAPDEETRKLFSGRCGMHEHTPFPSNYYHGLWLRHPAQNNLAPLSAGEKVDIVADFVDRPARRGGTSRATTNGCGCSTATALRSVFPLRTPENTGVWRRRNWKRNGWGYACIRPISDRC